MEMAQQKSISENGMKPYKDGMRLKPFVKIDRKSLIIYVKRALYKAHKDA